MKFPTVLLALAIAVAASFGVYMTFLLGAHVADQKMATLSSDVDALRDRVDAARGGNNPLFGAINTVGGLQYYLYGSGVGASDTSITLTYFYIPVSKQKLQMSDFGTVGYLTLEPGNATKQEFVSFSGLVQNGDGTATLTGVLRGLSPITPYTASSTLQKQHAGGTAVVVSNPPQLYNLFANKNNAESIYGIWTYSSTSLPKLDQNPNAAYWATAATTTLVTLGQLNDTALTSAVAANETTRGYVELATQLEMASSTRVGGTGANLALSTFYASSSPFTTGLLIPITQNDGKLSQSFLRLSDAFTFTGGITSNATTTINSGFIASSTQPTDTATINLDWGKANTFTTVLGGNRIITFSDLAVGESIKFVACQDGTGSRTLTWPSSVRWQFGAAPTLTTTAGKCDTISFFVATSTTSVFGATSANF